MLSSRVAAHLKGIGVGLESYVLLCFEKSAWAVVAMLGILKAGAAYVAVDPAHPQDHKDFIARTTSAAVALTGMPQRSLLVSLVDHVIGMAERLFRSLNLVLL